jgi:hypothetical protein
MHRTKVKVATGTRLSHDSVEDAKKSTDQMQPQGSRIIVIVYCQIRKRPGYHFNSHLSQASTTKFLAQMKA